MSRQYRDYRRDALFESELDPIARERELDALQAERVARLRQPPPDPEPESWDRGQQVVVVEERETPDEQTRLDDIEQIWAQQWEEEEEEEEEEDEISLSDRWSAVRDTVGEKITAAGEVLDDYRERVTDTIEHYDDRRLLGYGVDAKLLTNYRDWQDKYNGYRASIKRLRAEEAAATTDEDRLEIESRRKVAESRAEDAYREMRSVKHQIDSQVEQHNLIHDEIRAKSAELKRKEKGISATHSTPTRRSRTGISDRGLENRMLPKTNPARGISLLPTRRGGPGIGTDVRRNQNIDLSVRGNPNAISPVVRRGGSVTGTVPPLSGGVSPLVQRRGGYAPVLHQFNKSPDHHNTLSSISTGFRFPTVNTQKLFAGVSGGNVVDNINKNFNLNKNRGGPSPWRYNRRYDTTPTKSTSSIVEKINGLVGGRGATITLGTPSVNLPTINPARFTGVAVTPKKAKKKKGTKVRKRRNVADNLTNLTNGTLGRFRK